MTGAGSTWDNAGQLILGPEFREGTGSLTVQDGGTVITRGFRTFNRILLGAHAGQSGFLNIGAAFGDEAAVVVLNKWTQAHIERRKDMSLEEILKEYD